MRLQVLKHGHRPLQKIQLGLIGRLVGKVPPPILWMSYRREHFGKWMAPCFQEAMRETIEWRPTETELFASFVSNLNRCVY
jgi:hypothetical protein